MNFILKHKKIITTTLLIIFMVLISAIFLQQKRIKDIKDIENISLCDIYNKTDVHIGKNILHVDIADTECKLELGLSGRKSMEGDQGMLFIFNTNSYYGFWMKDMNFPIDIIWLSSNFIITGIEKNLEPSTYPDIYGEKYLAQYVLELPSGYTDKNNVHVGDKIIFSQKTL